VLASASPRRKQILEQAGWPVTVRPAEVDERVLPGEQPLACCERLARDKAAAVAATLAAGTALGGDTVVVVGEDLLGKPADREQAAEMLGRLSGRRHRVASAVALQRAGGGPVVSGVAVSTVRFDPLDGATLEAYLASGEWEGKAGAYAIQGQAGAFARLESGRLDTVIGLPMELVETLAAQLVAAALAEESP